LIFSLLKKLGRNPQILSVLTPLQGGRGAKPKGNRGLFIGQGGKAKEE